MSKKTTPTKRRNIAQHEYILLPEHMEHPKGDSMTVPDESMTIREIMKKHVSGMRIKEALYREGFYEDTDDFDSPDYQSINRLDLVEKDELREATKQKVEDLTQKQKAAQAAKKATADGAREKPDEGKAARTTKEDEATPPKSGEKPAT